MLTDTKLKALRPRAMLYRVTDGKGLCVGAPERLALVALPVSPQWQGTHAELGRMARRVIGRSARASR
jgi:hypothetical protein